MTPKNKPTNTTKKITSNLNYHLRLQSNSKELPNFIEQSDFEICQIMSEILNVSQERIAQNISLFKNINHYFTNALFYLSKIKSTQDIISAIHSLEFICNFSKESEVDLK